MIHAIPATYSTRLTPREAQLAPLIAEGLSNKEIAFRAGIAVGTVKVYLSRLYSKVGVDSRLKFALYWLKTQAAA